MRACGTPHAQGRNPKGLLSSLSAFNYNTFLFLFQYIFSYKSLQQPLLRRRHPRAFPFMSSSSAAKDLGGNTM